MRFKILRAWDGNLRWRLSTIASMQMKLSKQGTLDDEHVHEIRDPIHGFIRVDSLERKALDSRPFQRLRHIHQLAMAYLVYPGATHRRFEHSLGVMDLAGRIYDTVTDPANLLDDASRDIVPENGKFDHQRWRRIVQMAALCHDVGHLPFSHAGENLLPNGMKHEHLSIALIESPYLRPIWSDLNIKPEDVAKLAVGPEKYTQGTFSDWESILAEIIIGDALADRIDYLLRDSHHAGVAYGRFDHLRLIDNLRILPKSDSDGRNLTLGINLGGLHAAEALVLARYFMYSQVYSTLSGVLMTRTCRLFLKASLPNGMFSVDLKEHLDLTDNEIMSNILEAARTPSHPGNIPARLIVERDHFRLLYRRNPDDVKISDGLAGELVRDAAIRRYGETSVHYFSKREKDSGIDFPVWSPDRRIASSITYSEVLQKVPVVAVDYVFIAHEKQQDALTWLKDNRQNIIKPSKENET